MEKTEIKNAIKFPIMGIDYGTKHIGIAISDSGGRIAAPLPTFHITKNRKKNIFILELKESIVKLNVKSILLGLPQDFNDKESESAKQIKNFAKLLKENVSIPVFFYDESFSTKNAQNMLLSIGKNQKSTRSKIDSYACTTFLQEYLDSIDKKAK
jgi:putative holliday junction resolvase